MTTPAVGSAAWKAEDKGPYVLAICWTVIAVSTLFVMARLYVRGKILGGFQLDDYLVVMALVCGYISTSISTLAVEAGSGRHFSLLTTQQKESALKWTIAGFPPGIFSFGLPKLAVIVLLTRLLNPSPLHKWILWTIGIWCQFSLIAVIGVLLGRCTPASAQWDSSVKGTCFSVDILVVYAIYAGSFSAFVDFYLAIYPTIVLFKLHMPMKKKLALSVALGLGIISAVVAIYKTTHITSLESDDFTYNTCELTIWTVVEGSTIIIACSIPILQPLVKLVLHWDPFSSAKESKTPRYYQEVTDQKEVEYELGVRKVKPKARDDLGLTIVEDDSQENILNPQGHSEQSLSKGNANGIVRTDVVKISYDTPSDEQGRETSGAQRWKAF